MNVPIEHVRVPNEMKAPMKTVPFDLFPADEQEYFVWSCRHWGKTRDEFLVRAEEEDVTPGPLQPLRREVIVKHVLSGNARRYGAGQGSNWISAFQDDLHAGLYRTCTITS
jgi:hypothetical protein